jgi:hypothetical protein
MGRLVCVRSVSKALFRSISRGNPGFPARQHTRRPVLEFLASEEPSVLGGRVSPHAMTLEGICTRRDARLPER